METQIAVWNWCRNFCMIWHFIFFWQILSPGLQPRHQVRNSSSDSHTARLAAAVSGASGVLSIMLFLKWFPRSSSRETHPGLLRVFVADRSLLLTCLQRRRSHFFWRAATHIPLLLVPCHFIRWNDQIGVKMPIKTNNTINPKMHRGVLLLCQSTAHNNQFCF